MYENLLGLIKHDGTKLAVCAVNYIYEDGKKANKAALGKNCTFDFYHAIVEMNTHRLFDMGAWSKLYHKSLFDDLRFLFLDILYHDLQITERLRQLIISLKSRYELVVLITGLVHFLTQHIHSGISTASARITTQKP